MVVTILPIVIGLFAGKYSSRCTRRSCWAAVRGAHHHRGRLGMIQEAAKSKVPALGYTVTYAVGNTLLTIWGVVIVILMG